MLAVELPVVRELGVVFRHLKGLRMLAGAVEVPHFEVSSTEIPHLEKVQNVRGLWSFGGNKSQLHKIMKLVHFTNTLMKTLIMVFCLTIFGVVSESFYFLH